MIGTVAALGGQAAKCSRLPTVFWLVLLATIMPRAGNAAVAPDSLAPASDAPSPPAIDVPEPPVDAADDADVIFERAAADSNAGVEVAFGLRGSGSGPPQRARTLRFLGNGLDGVVRDGADDPLAGAEISSQSPNRQWRVGRAAPQWACGWLVGSPRAPWGAGGAGALAGLRAGPRGDVATLAVGNTPRFEAMVGRFARRDVAALRAEVSGIGLVVAGTHGEILGYGLTARHDLMTTELALDRRGRWRGETQLARTAPIGQLAIRARAGSAGFLPLLAPTRGGPAQSLTADWSFARGGVRPRAGVALWRFREGLDGARGKLEVDLSLAHHAAWTLGVEEQRGTRRDRSLARGMRQGWWGEWRGGSGPVGLTLGLENWGRRSRARSPVRSASLAAVELRTPFGGRLRAEQRAFRSGSGEGYRVADLEADRLVLRALSGAGERTKVELVVPGPAGRMRAGWTLHAAASRPARSQWTLDWTRRARIGGAAP